MRLPKLNSGSLLRENNLDTINNNKQLGASDVLLPQGFALKNKIR